MLEVDIRRRLGAFHLATAFSAADEIAVLFGPSGAGKSLTLQAIAGILRPDKGLVRVNGLTAFDSSAGINLPPQERRIGYVPQGYALFPHLTVAHNVGYGLSGLDRRRRAERVQEMVRLLGLDGLEERRPRELSGGQQQRVALARALVFRPRLLLLDEPFAALDEAIRSTLRQELLDIRRRMAVTIVLVTHDLVEA
ncbi:MAG TPA: ATP-binding cassette domain-containing protein, partial [Dehalococcoidia bacterium]|nr:ATP-binding cassette domain-containing protein [Dehalococcoidia bacterium]